MGQPSGPPEEVNLIIPPHGSESEVALTAGRIAAALPAERKVAVILAAYHFVPNTPLGFSIAQAMDAHSDFLVVLGETSPFKVPSENIFTQIRQARDQGYTDLILFGEGRLPSRGGGLTPVSTESFQLIRPLLRRQKLAATITLISGTFNNIDRRIGQGTDPVHFQTEAWMDATQAQTMAEQPGLFAATVDVLWHWKTFSVNADRIGAASGDKELIQELQTRFLTLTNRVNCLQEIVKINEE